MKSKLTRTATLLGIALLGLSACSTDAASHDEAAAAHLEAYKEDIRAIGVTIPEGEQSQPGPKPIEGVSFENAWSEKQLRDYMTYLGANSLEAFHEETPERNITAVTNPEDGVVRFEVRDRDYEAGDWYINDLAISYMLYTGCAAEDVDAVIVETAGGGDSAFQDGCQ